MQYAIGTTISCRFDHLSAAVYSRIVILIVEQQEEEHAILVKTAEVLISMLTPVQSNQYHCCLVENV